MTPELYALGNAFFLALHNLLTKKGLRYSNPGTALLSSLFVNIVVLWGVCLIYVPWDSLATATLLFFMVVGLFQPGLTRLLTYKGIEKLGIAITDPLRSTTPLFSALMAVFFLGEQLTVSVGIAMLLIIVGVTLLSYHDGSKSKIITAAVFYPILASVFAAVAQVMRKFGLGAILHPILAAAVTASASLAVSALTLSLTEGKDEPFLLNRKCLPWYIAAGFAVSIGMVSIYYALDRGDVTIVTPLSSTGPLFSLLFSALFLKDVEKVTLKIIFGAALIVFGVVLISVWK